MCRLKLVAFWKVEMSKGHKKCRRRRALAKLRDAENYRFFRKLPRYTVVQATEKFYVNKNPSTSYRE